MSAKAKKVIVTFPNSTIEQINAFGDTVINAGGDILSNCYDYSKPLGSTLAGYMVLVGWTDADVASFWQYLQATIPGAYKKGF